MMITTTGLTKRYRRVTPVDGVDLAVGDGDRYGLLGPNGSGKTTLLRLLLGLVYATSGTIALLDRPVPRRIGEVLPQVGALVESPGGYGHLSGRANLTLFDAAGPGGPRRTRRARVGEVLDWVGLGGVDNRPVKAYSLGMRQRLGLAAALLRTPRLLVLDEPTNGLDPRGIREVRDLLTELNHAGTTLLLSSHQLSEVDQMCTRVGVMDRGKLVVQSDLDTLRTPTGLVEVHTADPGPAAALLDGRVAHREEDRLVVHHDDAAGLNAELVAAGIRVAGIRSQRRTLEEVVWEATSASADRVDRVGSP